MEKGLKGSRVNMLHCILPTRSESEPSPLATQSIASSSCTPSWCGSAGAALRHVPCVAGKQLDAPTSLVCCGYLCAVVLCAVALGVLRLHVCRHDRAGTQLHAPGRR